MTSKETFYKVLKYISKYWFLVLCSLLFALVTVILNLYVPILFGDTIDGIISKGNVDFNWIFGILKQIIICVLAYSVLTWAMNVINNHITYHVVQDIRAKAIRQIQVAPLSYLDSHGTGDTVQRIIADVDQFSDGLLLGFTQLFTGIVTIIATLIFMIQKSLPVTLFVMVLTPVSFLVARFIATRSFSMFRLQTQSRGKQTSYIEEMIENQKIVKAFGHEQESSEEFSKMNKELQNYSQKAVFYSSLTNPSTRFVNNLIYAGVALLGAFIILQGNLTVGGLSVLLNYSNQYMKPFNDISSVITELQNALACAARVFEFIESPQESPDAKEELSKANGQVDINDVSFSYVKDQPLIENFNLHVEPGMRIAIVGPTGCGKTTMINLLMRFYDVNSGEIQVDGNNIQKVSRHSLRSNYGMVLQETWLKYGTVRENITVGKPDASDEEIIQAAKAAHSYEFIKRLPKGLDTIINEDRLSQGQKQLLCITRVMLSLPPMLILDEATSSIDTRTEILIQEAFDTLMQGRTSFVVAHRLSTIRNADLILVMKNGKIIEQGNHDTLLTQKGFYYELYNSQFKGVSI